MKLYRFLAITVVASVFLTSCSDDENSNVGKGESINDFRLLGPTNFSSVTLNPSTPTAPITLSWEAAKAGLGGQPVYTVMIDEKGGDFSTPVFSGLSDNDGEATSITFQSSELSAEVAGLSTNEFIWTVEAKTTTNAGDNLKRATNAFNINIKSSTVGIAKFSYLGPSVNQKVVLNTILTPNDEVEFSWNAATVSGASEVTYTWQASATANGFDEPILEFEADDNGEATTLTLTQNELAEALADVEFTEGVYWRVLAHAGDFSYAPETRFVWFEIIDIPQVYVVGSFTQGGWQNNCTDALLIPKVTNGIFEKLVNVPAGGEFKFVLNCGSWATAWGGPGGAVNIGQEYDLGGENIIITNAGYYFLHLDLVRSKFIIKPFTPPANLYLVGGSTDIGWSPGSSIPFRKIDEGQFELFAKLTPISGDGNGFKFLQVQDWPGDWGADPNNAGKIIQDGEANATISEEGFYKINVNFLTSTYTTVKTSWGVVGGATPGGWGTDTDMVYEGNYTWSVDIALTADEWKFRANDAWDINMGADTGMLLKQGGPNFVNATPGNYHITMTLHPVNGYSYTITPN